MEQTLKPLHEAMKTLEYGVDRLIGDLLGSIAVVHAEHLITKSYARHMALDQYYKTMPELVDALAEAVLSTKDVRVVATIPQYTDVESMLDALLGLATQIHRTVDPVISNPLEDVMSLIAKTMYLLRMS